MSASLELPRTVTPTPRDSGLAGESGRLLAKYLDSEQEAVRFAVQDGNGSESVTVPMSAFRLFTDMLSAMARGEAVALIPTHTELTTQEAADLLLVSRPYLVKLLDDGKIPHHKVGTHRRIRFDDLMAYKRASDAERRRALEELVARDEELGLE